MGAGQRCTPIVTLQMLHLIQHDMKPLSLILALLLLAGVSTESTIAEPTVEESSHATYHVSDECPEEDNDRARRWLKDILENQEARQNDGIYAEPEDVRVMNNDDDPEACAEIAAFYADVEDERLKYFFYTTGDYHFNVSVLRPGVEDPMAPPNGNIFVYDEDHNIIKIYI